VRAARAIARAGLAAGLLAAGTALAEPAAWSGGPPPPPLARTPASPARPAPVDVRLASGLRVVVVERHARPIVTLDLVVPRGTVTDPPRELGVTWLAIHLATDYRERGDQGESLAGEKSLRRQFVELGGSLGAVVQPDFAALRAAGYAQDAGRLLALLGEAVVTPRHGAESYAQRRNALLDALDDLESSSPAALARVVEEAAFGAGHPYARSAIGTRQSLRPLGLEDVVAHQERILAPQGATLLVVGDVRPDRVLADARRAFARWDREAISPVAVPPPAAPRPGAEVGFLRRQPASTLVACVTRPLADVPGSDAAFEVLAAILGEGIRSRLSQALREERGLTYTPHAVLVRRRAARALVACAPLDAARAGEGLGTFRAALEALRAAPPRPEELRRAKALRLAEREEAQDDALRTAEAWLEAIALRGGLPRLEQERAELERVGPDEVRRVAAAALRAESLRWILSGDPAAAARAVQEARLGKLVPLPVGR
jgi:zinc protease